MDHIASVRAALKASAPVVASPIEGRYVQGDTDEE